MSFTYLRESAGEYSAVCSTEISQSEQLKLKNTLGKCLFNGRLTDVCQSSLFGMMLALFPVIVCTVWWGIVAPAWRKSTCLNRREDRRLWE